MTHTPQRSGRTLLLRVTMTVAVVACWLNGLVIYFFEVSFQLMGDTADRGEYLTAAGGCVTTAVLLALGLVALRVVRAPRWLLWTTAAGVGTLLGIAWSAQRRSTTADVPSTSSGTGFGDGVVSAFMVPGSWPLLVLLVAALVVLVRGRSSRAPR